MGRRSTRSADGAGTGELVQGTLDMLILRTLLPGPVHGYAIAQRIRQLSEELLEVHHGSLYPALQRLQQEDWIRAEWGTSVNNRQAKFYALTASGRRQLEAEASRWDRLTRAIRLVMAPPRKTFAR
jgi:PadR family transcriptional regulator PadR